MLAQRRGGVKKKVSFFAYNPDGGNEKYPYENEAFKSRKILGSERMISFFINYAKHLFKKDAVRALIILSSLILLFFFDVVFLGRTVSPLQVPGVMGYGPYGDTQGYTHRAWVDPAGGTWGPRAHNAVISKSYKERTVPLWISYATGQPLAANMDSNAFNPLRILLYLNPSPYAWDLFLLMRLLIAGFFTFLFMRAIKISFGSSIFSSILFMFSGYFIFSIDMHHLDVEIFLPLVFLCFEKLLQREKIFRWGVLASATVFLTVVGGQPQSSFLILSFGCLYCFFRIFSFQENRHFKIVFKHLATLAAVLIIGFLVSAFLLIPFFEFVKLSVNNHAPGLGLNHDPHFFDFISFFVPYFLGLVHMSWVKDYSWHILTRGYVGVVAFLFAFSATIITFKTKGRYRGFIYFFFISLVLMLAKLYGFSIINWIGKLPIGNMVNYGKYLGPLIGFCFAILAGFCLEKISGPSDFLSALKKSACFIVLIMIGTFFYHYRYMGEHSSDFAQLKIFSFLFLKISLRELVIMQMILALSFIGAIIGTYWLYAREKRIKLGAFKFIICGIALIELFLYMPNPGIAKHRNQRYDIFTKAPYIDFLKANLQNHRVIGVDRILYPDFASVFGIQDVRVLEAFMVKRYMELIHAFFTCPPDRFTGDEGIDFNNQGVKRILNLLGVKYILCNKNITNNLISADIIARGRIAFSPGKPNEQWINLSTLAINNSSKEIMFEHAPSRIEYSTKIPKMASLDFSIGMVPGCWAPDKGDGVLFEIMANDGSQEKLIFSKYIDPKKNVSERKWFDYSLDVSSYAEKNIILSFITLPGENNGKDNGFDWSAWGDISIYGKNKNEYQYKLVYDKEIKIVENLDVFPRAFIVHAFTQIKNEKSILEALKNDRFDLRNKIIIEDNVPADVQSKLLSAKDGGSVADIVKYGSQKVEIAADMKSPGFLILSDTYYPGWVAYVDGQKTKIYAADYILRAVFLEKGTHKVDFAYEPASFKLGVLISMGTLFFVACVSLAIIRAKRKKTAARSS